MDFPGAAKDAGAFGVVLVYRSCFFLVTFASLRLFPRVALFSVLRVVYKSSLKFGARKILDLHSLKFGFANFRSRTVCSNVHMHTYQPSINFLVRLQT